MKNNMEQYLQQKHSENYTGTDDDMPDAFESWLGNMQVDDLIKYADELTQQALAEERARVRGSVNKTLDRYVVKKEPLCEQNSLILLIRTYLLSSLDKPVPDKEIEEMPQMKGTLEALDKLTIIK